MTKHFPHRNPQLDGKLRTVARQMRSTAMPAEDILWERLRGRKLNGSKFRRQCLLDRFIVDFYCPAAGLIVEVDGEVHQQQIEADLEREQILTALGFRIIRFTNHQVLQDVDQVLNHIQSVIKDTPSPFSGFDEDGEGVGG